VAKFKYSGTTITNQSHISEEIKSTLNTRSACYHSVQSILPSRHFFKNLTCTKPIVLPVVLDEYETWSLALREEIRLRDYENRVLRRKFVT
jgi:hypothetical protein